MGLIKIRDFFINSAESLLSLLKVILLSKILFNKTVKTDRSKPLIILGNGPSLKESMKAENFDRMAKFLCVNYFSRTDEYILLKPSYYVITSLEYFFEEEKEEFAVERRVTLEKIRDETNWPLTLFVPAKARKQKAWKEIIRQNTNITINYFNNTPISGFSSVRHFFFRNNFGMPRPHNVLIPSLLLAINMQYKEIYLYGADHSWLQEIVVDNDNEVLLSQKHFYDKQASKQKQYRDMAVPQPMYHGGTSNKRKLHEVLEKFYFTFRSYWVLEAYAKSRNCKVYNFTPGSFIDAFERKGFNNN